MFRADVSSRRSWLSVVFIAALVIGIVGAAGCVCCVSPWGMRAVYSLYRTNRLARHPEEFTAALDPEVVTHLCSVLELEDDPRCSGSPALSYDFLPDFLERYSPGTPRRQVMGEIGLYETGCSQWVRMSDIGGDPSGAGEIQYCQFDFRGDSAYVLGVAFQRRVAEQPDEVVGRACICALCDDEGWVLQCNLPER